MNDTDEKVVGDTEKMMQYLNIDGTEFNDEDWFSRHKALWEPIINLLKPKRILEIGSYEGRSACFMIKAASTYNPIDIYCIDTWQGGQEHVGQNFVTIENRFNKNVRLMAANAANPVTIHKIKGRSAIELSRILCELGCDRSARFDLIYVDGSHQAADVFVDAALSFQLLQLGGVLIFDDYLVLDNVKTEYDVPQIAIDAFVKVYQNKLKTIIFTNEETQKEIEPEKIYQLYLRKVME